MEAITGYTTSSTCTIGENPELLWCKQLLWSVIRMDSAHLHQCKLRGGSEALTDVFISTAAGQQGISVKIATGYCASAAYCLRDNRRYDLGRNRSIWSHTCEFPEVFA